MIRKPAPCARLECPNGFLIARIFPSWQQQHGPFCVFEVWRIVGKRAWYYGLEFSMADARVRERAAQRGLIFGSEA